MQKRKQGPALFELLNEGQGDVTATIKMPKSWKVDPPIVRSAAKPRVSRPPVREPVDVAGGSIQTDGRPVSWFELDGERIRVSVTSLGAAGVIFGALVIVLGAFEIGSRIGRREGLRAGYDAGRASYAADASRSIEAARAQPPEERRVEELLDEPANSAPATAASTPDGNREATPGGWISDFTYIVAQEFSAARSGDANRAQTYLGDHGIATELVRFPSGSCQLITLQGFNHADVTQKKLAEQLLKRIRAVGAKYFAEGGGYKLEGYYKTLKGTSW